VKLFLPALATTMAPLITLVAAIVAGKINIKLDRSLRDLMRHHNNGRMDIPFGGKVVVLGGDFRQILPVVPKANRQEVVNSSVNSLAI
jgi:hypothetical protein